MNSPKIAKELILFATYIMINARCWQTIMNELKSRNSSNKLPYQSHKLRILKNVNQMGIVVCV